MKQSTAWLALITLASAAASAGSQGTDEVRSEKVNFSDLNVNTLAGVNVLYDRIAHAARLVCAPADESKHRSEFNQCYQTAIDAAIARVNNPLLSAVHQNRSGSPVLASLQSPRSQLD
jgi:UrcA family protein